MECFSWRSISSNTLLLTLLLLLCLSGRSRQCGPGRGAGRRRGPRKMTPLVFKQHVPNISENTLGASGLSEGRISRDDPKFKDLVENHNPDIVFKNEEGTGEDRIMTQRCKNKLNNLAIMVMTQWPGVKLKVTEAWDEDGFHAKDSLHYEGRAVDITTDDRDRSKYGMLARLAVEAEFDWVYYESRGHIHCSVKSDSSITAKTGGCYSSSSTVLRSDGATIPMSQLQIGDSVLSVSQDGRLEYSPVIMFLHHDEEGSADFLTVQTEEGQDVTLTPTHLIPASDNLNNTVAQAQTIFARDIQPGMYIYALHPGNRDLRAVQVKSVTSSIKRGAFAPLTKHGTVVVNNVLTSCYAVILSQDIAHAALAPIRWTYDLCTWLRNVVPDWLIPSMMSSTSLPHGIHWYVDLLYSTAQYVIPENLMFHN